MPLLLLDSFNLFQPSIALLGGAETIDRRYKDSSYFYEVVQRLGAIFNDHVIADLLLSLMVKNFENLSAFDTF